MAKCHKQPNGQGQYTVTFTPVEVGDYTVHVRWNGRDIEGKVIIIITTNDILTLQRVNLENNWMIDLFKVD